MKKVLNIIVLAMIAFAIVSCSKEGKLRRRIPGIWNLDKIEVSGSSTYTVDNAGTVEFKKDGTGKNNLSYTLSSGDVNDKEAFKWENTEETVTIKGNANSTYSTMIFTVDDNAKNTQVWIFNSGVDTYKWTLTKQ